MAGDNGARALAERLCAAREPTVEATADMFVDDECRALAAAILANGAVFLTAEKHEEILTYIDGLSTALNDYLMSPHADPLKDGHADGFCRRCAAMYEAGMKAISDEDEWTPALQPEGSAGTAPDRYRELAARFWVHYRCGYVDCEIVEQHEHGGGPPMREMTPDERAATEGSARDGG